MNGIYDPGNLGPDVPVPRCEYFSEVPAPYALPPDRLDNLLARLPTPLNPLPWLTPQKKEPLFVVGPKDGLFQCLIGPLPQVPDSSWEGAHLDG